MRATLNIGLFIAGTTHVYPAGDAVYALRIEADLTPVRAKVMRPQAGEPTVVIEISRPLTSEEGNRIACRLQQDCIAQLREDGVGELFGPRCKEWEPFAREFFIT